MDLWMFILGKDSGGVNIASIETQVIILNDWEG